MSPFLRVGIITKLHGLRGEVKVFPTTDSPLRFGVIKKVLIRSGSHSPHSTGGSLDEHRIPRVKDGSWIEENTSHFTGNSRNQDNTFHSECKTLYIEGVKYFKNLVILKFKDIDSASDAERYKGCEIYIPREEGILLREGEYYIADIIGMDVIDENGVRIGCVRDVLETGANDVYIISRGDQGKDLLVPAIKECILKIDIENNLMRVHILDGLMDL